ncbi:MAG TPA: hypothetical protein VEV84_16045 [Pyrinomonadaceae bacterium]|nr:hypothetical protein [Pyrinomonadaceae bacterium]
MKAMITSITSAVVLSFLALGAACAQTRGTNHTGHDQRSYDPNARLPIGRSIVINGDRVSDEVLNPLEQYYHVRVPDGRYWYDAVSGAWGVEGGPTRGFTTAGMQIGGPLQANASNGNTRVFINGRELHRQDVASLNMLIAPYSCVPGRYWVDSNGNFGVENGPVLGNLVQIAQAKFSGGQKKSHLYDSGIGSVISDGSGFIGYISDSSSATRW